MATDDQAVAHIQKQLNIIGLDILSPRTVKLQNDIKGIITRPENVGDLHLKLLLSETQNYAVNRTLVEYVIKAFYTILWDVSEPASQTKLELDVLAGEHNEVAFVEIKTDIVREHCY